MLSLTVLKVELFEVELKNRGSSKFLILSCFVSYLSVQKFQNKFQQVAHTSEKIYF